MSEDNTLVYNSEEEYYESEEEYYYESEDDNEEYYESEEEIQEEYYEEEQDKSNDYIELFEDLQLENISKKLAENQKAALLMANYHLRKIEGYICDKSIVSNRFDTELAIRDISEDSLAEFRSMLFSDAKRSLEISCTSKIKSEMDYDISTLFYEFICSNVVCSSKKIWYFDGMKWNQSDTEHFIWDELHSNFMHFLRSNESLREAFLYLNTKSCRDKVISDVKKRLYYHNFESNIDSSSDVIGVLNGVLDINTGSVREGKISDFISKCTNVEYIPYSMESREISILMKLLRKVFPIEDLLKFFIRSCSSFLEGRNSKKVFYVWWGSGNNCKTGMQTLVQAALGEYAGTVPVSLITSKRGSSSDATPELCHIEGKLVVFLQEPNPNEKIKTGRIKELTGNDKVFVRNLFETGREIDVKCKIVHTCNFPTAGPDNDKAFKRRMKVIKFPSTFLEESEYNSYRRKGILEPYMYKVEDNIEDKFRTLGFAFLSLLVREYQLFKDIGLETPEIVEKNTEEFLTYNNIILKFIRKQLCHKKGGGCMTTDSLYECFKLWTKNFFPSYNLPNNESFIKELRDEGFQDTNGDGIIKNVILSEDFANIAIP